ncbi:MAG: cation diffusion facilitator family transporter [Clostridiales bacterium]|jgi:cation diffusion facilitator family transporter|nr:cation diffusion facilitator family transporter [Clostridiales bacterium]
MENSDERFAVTVSKNAIAINSTLSILKLSAGVLGHSSAMISDAVHTFSDTLSTIIVIIGVKLANKESDKEHPYGHERFECVAAIILAAVLFMTGVGIGVDGVKKIFFTKLAADGAANPGLIALAAAVLSIAVKEAMYRYTKFAAKKIDSGALMADAWHHRSDALSSIGSFIGILGAKLGFAFFDPLAGIVICLFILKTAVDIFMDAVGKMTDRSCPELMTDEIRGVILTQNGVIGIDQIRTRAFGNKVYMDLEISANENVNLRDAHEIAHRVHDIIERRFPKVKHCMVHVNPVAADDSKLD